jgi:hypothetical protein
LSASEESGRTNGPCVTRGQQKPQEIVHLTNVEMPPVSVVADSDAVEWVIDVRMKAAMR